MAHSSPALPEILRDAWRRAGLADTPGPHLVRALGGGRSNRSYLIEADGARWVVRLNHPDAARLGVDRQREQTIWRAAAAAGLAPELLFADCDAGVLIAAYIEGTTATAAGMTARQRDQLLETLANLHALPTVTPAFDYRAAVNRLCAPGAELPARLEDAIALLETGGSRVLCHHDLIPANVCFGAGQAWLLDWEYAGAGFATMDYATLAIEWPGLFDGQFSDGIAATHLAAARTLYAGLCTLWQARRAELE